MMLSVMCVGVGLVKVGFLMMRPIWHIIRHLCSFHVVRHNFNMQQLTRATSSWIVCDVTDCAVNYFPIYGGELYI